MIKKTIFVVVFILFVFVVNGNNIVNANSEVQPSYSYSKGLNNASIEGTFGTHYEYFSIEDYWDITFSSLTLNYNISEAIDVNSSSITILVNDSPFYSFRPDKSATYSTLTINLPTELLKSGVNYIAFRISNNYNVSSQYINVCVDDVGSKLSFNILDTSFLLFDYTKQTMKLQINEFVKRFLSIDMLQNEESVIYVSNDASIAELESGIHTLTGLAREVSDDLTTIPLLTFDETEIQKKQNAIYIANYDKLSEDYKTLIGDQIDLNTNAVIKLINLNKPILVVTSKNDELLIHAGKYFSNYEFIRQIASDVKIVDTKLDSRINPHDYSFNIKLSENGEKIVGWNEEERNYYLTQPSNNLVDDFSMFKLDFSYSKNLDFNNSNVTVFINDIEIGHKKLSDDLANQDMLYISIPKNANLSGNFLVKVKFNLVMKKPDCFISIHDTPWFYIHNSSELQLKTVDNNEMLFNYYPANFIKNGTFNNIAVVIPTEINLNIIKTIGNVFNLIGDKSSSNEGQLYIYDDTVSLELLKNKNIILIGTFVSNQFIRNFNENFYFKYNHDGSGFISNEKRKISNEYGQNLGSLQLLPSPYSQKYQMLVVTGTSSTYYEAASRLISSPESLWRIYGDAVITDYNGAIYSHRFKISEGVIKKLYSSVVNRFDLIYYILLSSVVFSILTYILFNLLNKQNKK